MFLEESDEEGICILDNIPEQTQWQYFAEKYHKGLNIMGLSQIPLPRIRLYAASCINAGNVNSAMDIVLGSFRYCVNDPANRDAARQMLVSILPLLWGRLEDGSNAFIDKGLILRPPLNRVVKKEYKKIYQQLVDYLTNLATE
jgi:hypothetical protein